jgi:radical SAM superfamily enzyme YgiQ (UPF0313 family)
MTAADAEMATMKNALLVNPEFPVSYWSFTYALELLNKKSNVPPLGLLTVAGLFPEDWNLRLVDMNVEPLRDEHIAWADAVFTSSMIVQERSLLDVVRRCNAAGVPVIAGGPHPTALHTELAALAPDATIDHFVLGEAEGLLPELLFDLRDGTAKPHYGPTTPRPDIGDAPLPRFDLIDHGQYGVMALQFSRGCPFDCEFCDITVLFGRRPRTKSSAQMLTELDALLATGWRGSVFLVDDNFIGNKRDALVVLKDIKTWQEIHGYPFSFMTEASVNLADLTPLLELMRDCAFSMVFLGIETPGEDALRTTSKGQNIGRKSETSSYLLHAVRTIQSYGIEVSGGFIIGLDGDREFDSHLQFIREAGIPIAMTGLLTALKGTRLHGRLASEGRLHGASTGSNTEIALNFDPELPRDTLLHEYRRVISTLYEPTLRGYFERCVTYLERLAPRRHEGRRVGWIEVRAMLRSIQRQLFSRQGPAYARFFVHVVRHHPEHLAEAFRLAIKGYHFERLTRQELAVDAFAQLLETESSARSQGRSRLTDTAISLRYRLARLRVDRQFRPRVDAAVSRFREARTA